MTQLASRAYESRPKILLVTRNFPPLIGGMERLIHHVYLELLPEFDVWVVGPQGCQDYLMGGTHVSTFPPSPALKFLACCLRETVKAAGTFEPNLFFCGSGVVAPAVILARRRTTSAAVVAYLHGLDVAARILAYRLAFIPAIRSANAVIANSTFTAALAEGVGINREKIFKLNPGVTRPEIDAGKAADFRSRIGAGTRPILLYVGRLTVRKGLAPFVEHCLPEIVKSIPQILLTVIGGEAKQALNYSAGVAQRVMEIAAAKGVAGNIRMLGEISDVGLSDELSSAYAASQLLVFPVLDRPGDVEGFGMVAIEAAAHGLPTVAFGVGGVPDAVSDGVSGYLISPCDYEKMTRMILHHLTQAEAYSRQMRENCLEFAKRFSWDRFGARLRGIVWTILGKR